MSRRLRTLLGLAALAVGCGGGSPTGPNPNPTPTPVGPTYDLEALVFYDEDGNGQLSDGERVRLGDVMLEVAGKTGRTEPGTGRVTISGVPGGTAAIRVRVETLPYYFVAPEAQGVDLPQAPGATLLVPVTLPIAPNRPNRYMAFGDSITVGDGSRSGAGYRDRLQELLTSRLGAATVVNEGLRGTQTASGAERIFGSLSARRPAYTIIVYGTNDWNDCKGDVPCVTLENLRYMVRAAKQASSMPVLATILPANPDFPKQVPPARNDWVHNMNAVIRPMAAEEGVALADLEAAFLEQPRLQDLFDDHVHPNDAGYEVIAQELGDAITRARSGSSASLRALGLFSRPEAW